MNFLPTNETNLNSPISDPPKAPESKQAFGAINNVTPNKQSNPQGSHGRKSQLTSLAIILLIVVSGLGIQKVYKRNKIQKDLVKVEQVIEAQKTNQVIQDNQTVSLGLKKAFLEKQREEQIFWSNVLVHFNELMQNNKNVSNSSFSGNQEGNLAFSAKTKSSSNDPYLDTALLIEKFKASSYFNGMFIPSISATVSESGEETLSYNVRVDYLKNEIDTELIEDINLNDTETIEVDTDAVEELADTLRGQIEATETEDTPIETPEATSPDTTSPEADSLANTSNEETPLN